MGRGFNDIQPYQRKTSNPNWDSAVSSVIRGALDDQYILEGQRVPKLRPSSFPKCPILDYMKLLRHKHLGYIDDVRSFSSSYFTGVGTVVHEIIQHHIGNTTQVYGDWKCTNMDCEEGQASCTIYDATGKVIREGKITSVHTTDNKCPSCKRPMHYEELEITFKGVTGHVDCVMVISDKKWWVVDYKTTLKRKVAEGKLPESQHLYQLQAYCYILKFVYNLPIQGFSLVYLPRDNPFDFYEHSQDFSTDRHHQQALDIINNEKLRWKGAKKALKKEDHQYAVDVKPCSCIEDYHEKINFYTECPLLGICFKSNKLDSFLEKYKKSHKQGCVPKMATFTELVNIIADNDYAQLRKLYPKKSKVRRTTRRGITAKR